MVEDYREARPDFEIEILSRIRFARVEGEAKPGHRRLFPYPDLPSRHRGKTFVKGGRTRLRDSQAWIGVEVEVGALGDVHLAGVEENGQGS